LGRWLNKDVIEELGGFNLYSAMLNDGINRRDYLGLFDFRDALNLFLPLGGYVIKKVVGKVTTFLEDTLSIKNTLSVPDIEIKSECLDIPQSECNGWSEYKRTYKLENLEFTRNLSLLTEASMTNQGGIGNTYVINTTTVEYDEAIWKYSLKTTSENKMVNYFWTGIEGCCCIKVTTTTSFEHELKIDRRRIMAVVATYAIYVVTKGRIKLPLPPPQPLPIY
jgi:hypothetical protein